MRILSEQFLEDLVSGSLSRLIKAIQQDETLCLEIRDNYANVYYRGGSLFRIENKNGYTVFFDIKYLNHGAECGHKALDISQYKTMDDYIDGIPLFKREMDLWFSKHRKQEREFQHMILRENNFSTVSNDTDYFICDLEYANNESVQIDDRSLTKGSRFDMVGIRWLSNNSDRKNGNEQTLAIFEVKFGDGALTGSAGIVKHFEDLNEYVKLGKHLDLMTEAESQFNQKYHLELIEMSKSSAEDDYKGVYPKANIDRNTKPEYILIFINHKPAKKVLRRELLSAVETYPDLLEKVNIKIAQSSFMGYGLYADQMIDVSDFLKSDGF